MKPQPSPLLLIDDDRIQLTLTAAMLQHSGIASVSCMQLDELLDALRSDTFDVLLTDVQMPAINGFDLLKLLRASNLPQAQTIPVIAVTARSDMKPEEFTATRCKVMSSTSTLPFNKGHACTRTFRLPRFSKVSGCWISAVSLPGCTT